MSKEGMRGSPLQAKHQKTELRTLNERFQKYVSIAQARAKKSKDLEDVLAEQQSEHDKEVAEVERTYSGLITKFKQEAETSNRRYDQLLKRTSTDHKQKRELEEKYEQTEIRNTELEQLRSQLNKELRLLRSELETVNENYGNIKYKYQNFETERANFKKVEESLNERLEYTLEELNKFKNENRSQNDSWLRMLKKKKEEVTKKDAELKKLKEVNNVNSSKIRQEFDLKLKEFVTKREEQYKQEKTEWVRIFKEEFNRKLRSFKEANFDLSHSHKKIEEELNDFKERLAKTKQAKTELEIINRNLEEESEKLRNDLDSLRKTKDNDLKLKNIIISELRDKYKQKEIEFDELFGIKQQLAQEIDLYRRILQEAESEAGYSSPLQNRKKRKLDDEGFCNITPGIVRASEIARHDINMLQENDEQKDEEEEQGAGGGGGGAQDDMDSQEMVTPGEPSPLEFSSMDLTNSMIEIQNTSNKMVKLNGYTLTNENGNTQFSLPKKRTLKSKEKVRIIIGSNKKNFKNLRKNDIIWNAHVWKVWSGQYKDACILFDPDNVEVARIEIHPDMLPEQSKQSCLVM